MAGQEWRTRTEGPGSAVAGVTRNRRGHEESQGQGCSGKNDVMGHQASVALGAAIGGGWVMLDARGEGYAGRQECSEEWRGLKNGHGWGWRYG